MTNPTLPVTDVLSNFNDQLVNAARLLGRSKHRQAIFEAVYRGKRQTKTIKEIMLRTELSQTHVLKEGGKIAGLLLEKVPNGYKKKKEFSSRYKTILSMARDRRKLEQVPTKISPKTLNGKLHVNIAFPMRSQNAKLITIDDIDSFSKVKGQLNTSTLRLTEQKIKEGFQKITGETGIFKDWGGEKSDLFSTRIILQGRRVATAIAFKGGGTKGKLVPAKMGKNGDQINRLFEEPAELFFVVYWGQIESSVVSQMQALAIVRALSGQKVHYGVIDGNDLGRLVAAYPSCF